MTQALLYSMSTEQAEIFNEHIEQALEREIRERVLALRRLKGRGRCRKPRPYRLLVTRRKPGGPDTSRDIVEQLNYVASQLPGACKSAHWGQVHAAPLEAAAREIRRLRSAVYTSRGEPLGPRPKMQFVGPQVSSPERDVWLAGLTAEEQEAERRFGFPAVRYELDAFRKPREASR